MPATVHVTPSFHYDVAYLQRYADYLPRCFEILDTALDLLERHPDYRFLVEQVIVLDAWWQARPERRDALRRVAAEGRLEAAPGMWVMPDMNHADAESMLMQAQVGRGWLREHLDLEPTVCWIADCWGHHAQLPQILRHAGYSHYVFWRCMRRDVLRNDFVWRGLDGTTLPTHWLARSYSTIRFPDAQVANAPDLQMAGCSPAQVRALLADIERYGPSPAMLLSNSGDFMLPQASAPQVVADLDADPQLPAVRFSTLSQFVAAVDWDAVPIVDGEFNSAFQGTFTSNIRIKQHNRRLVRRLQALEALAVVTGAPTPARLRPDAPGGVWRLLLKQQFHDIVCGTICDDALADCLGEFERAAALLDAAQDELAGPRAAAAAAPPTPSTGASAFFNPLSFARTQVVADGEQRQRVEVPALGAAPASEAQLLDAIALPALPCTFETPWYRADIGADGFLRSLIARVEAGHEREWVRADGFPFGGLGLQMDYGDLWLQFEAPLSGGSLESSLTQNASEPLDPSTPGDLVNRATFRPQVEAAAVVGAWDGVLEVEQRGILSFWQLRVPFRTRVRLAAHTPRIEYETTIEPAGRHYRVRAVFPTPLADGTARYEIPCGIQARGPGQHVAQHWLDWGDAGGGLALLNAGTPGCSVDDGALFLSLFRAAAMEYKAPSASAFGEGVPHTFGYAVLPHGADADAELVRHGWAFNSPLLPVSVWSRRHTGWQVEPDHVVVAALRWHEESILLRLYEAVGRAASVRVAVPESVQAWAPADGLGQAQGEASPCAGRIELELRPFEIRTLRLRL